MDTIKINRIQITKLFDEINYDINFQSENPVSIITAPNGRGKTTMLNILNFVLEPTLANFKSFRGVPFEYFRCFFSNGKTIELHKVPYDKAVDKGSTTSRLMNGRGVGMNYRATFLLSLGDFEYSVYGKSRSRKSLLFSNIFNEAYHTDPSEYITDEDDMYFSRGRITPDILMKYLYKIITNYLEENNCRKPVNFIKADRIQNIMHMPRRPMRSYDDEPVSESPLKIASEEISEAIKRESEKYNDAVSQAKDKLPEMFLNGKGKALSREEFMAGWKTYRDELRRFQEIGLIPPIDDFTHNSDIESFVNPKNLLFLSTYLQAFQDTTQPLKDIYERMRLFKEILDERNSITGKVIMFSRDGVTLFAGSRKIELETLSSGEKHDFIMFYNLIFNTANGGLVLIDEPEISLHIEWQVNYLDRLIDICKMNGLQAIVATHSPNIVSSHYDCVVDKGETHE